MRSKSLHVLTDRQQAACAVVAIITLEDVMAESIDAPLSLVGKTFDCAFGEFVPRLTVLSPTELRVQATIGGTEIDNVVAHEMTAVRPGVVIMNWTEPSGIFVVQIQDHENSIVHNYARLADGQLFRAQGSIRSVPSA